ncbi:MAG: hypothetical protein HKN13_08915 [Rhodothermales bacterium]|nr:hypothetical protein [Rhodothermales bacterium]
MNLQTSGMEFASEMVIKATLLEMKIAEVPTTLSPDGRSRPPHLRSWRDGWRHLRFMLLFSPTWLFLFPGILLVLIGLLVGARLAFEPIAIGGVNFDVQSLLFMSAAVIVGFQSIVFAVFTKVFAFTEGLLPSGSRIVKWTNIVSLEAGLVVGFILLMAGLAGTSYSLMYWADSSFGSLDTSITLRFVVPSVTAIVLGFQVILSSFFLSILGLGRASQTVTADASTGKELAPSVRLQPTG